MTNQTFDDARIKHLELIQAVVARLGSNGFLVKGWTVTVASAFFGFAVTSGNSLLSVTAVIPTALFWGLDAYFLRCERLFRELYARVAAHDPSIPSFFLAATSPFFVSSVEPNVASWWRAASSVTLRTFYSTVIVAALVVAAISAIG